MTTIEHPQLITATPTTTAVVRAVVPMSELPAFYDRAFGALPQAITAQDVAILGPAFGLYHGIPGETADLEAGFPTDRSVQTDGEVTASGLPGGRVARTVHVGSFDELGPAWQHLSEWIAEQGLQPGDTFWEVYLTEPTPETDPRDLRTELNWSVQ